MDPFVEDDIEAARRTPPGEKLAQALELMEAGIRLKRASLSRTRPQATEREIDEALEHWLIADD